MLEINRCNLLDVINSDREYALDTDAYFYFHDLGIV